MNAVARKYEQITLTLQIRYESWVNDDLFAALSEETSGNRVPQALLSLFHRKRLAVAHKLEMLKIAGAEVNATCDYIIGRNRAAVPMPLWHYLNLKIESFLIMARSLLDVLSTCIAAYELSDRNVQSMNDLRKRGDCPQWLKHYVERELVQSPDLSLTKRGWLSLLITDNGSDQCLRDFVTHRGTLDFQFRELPTGEGWDIILTPRRTDQFVLPVKDIVTKVMGGMKSLSGAMETGFKA